MKFSCTQENLSRGLAIVAHTASKSANLPILHNVLVTAKDEGVELAATNLEIGMKVSVRGKVEEAGAFTVPAQVFANYVGLLSAERVDVEQEGNSLLVHAGNQNTKIRGEQAAEFPLIPDVDKKDAVVMPASELKQALMQVLVAVAHDDSRPELTGVLFQTKGNELVLASTDSYRLAERRIPLAKPVALKKSLIVPGNALSELVRVLPDSDAVEIQVFTNDSQALFVTPEVEITTRLIEGVFPDYEQIIPGEARTTSIIEKAAFLRAVKAASLFSKSGIHDVNLHFSPEKQAVTLTTVNNQVGENVTKVNAEMKGDSNSIIFNYRYLIDGVAQIPTSNVTLCLIDNVSPGVFRTAGADGELLYTYIIMPIKQ